MSSALMTKKSLRLKITAFLTSALVTKSHVAKFEFYSCSQLASAFILAVDPSPFNERFVRCVVGELLMGSLNPSMHPEDKKKYKCLILILPHTPTQSLETKCALSHSASDSFQFPVVDFDSQKLASDCTESSTVSSAKSLKSFKVSTNDSLSSATLSSEDSFLNSSESDPAIDQSAGDGEFDLDVTPEFVIGETEPFVFGSAQPASNVIDVRLSRHELLVQQFCVVKKNRKWLKPCDVKLVEPCDIPLVNCDPIFEVGCLVQMKQFEKQAKHAEDGCTSKLWALNAFPPVPVHPSLGDLVNYGWESIPQFKWLQDITNKATAF
jgi:hypothetical protein